MIELKNIKKQYIMGSNVINALDGVNLSIAEGEFVAVVGPSGSGKSTLMNILGCLDIPTEGEYILNGIPICNYKEYQLADIRNQKIGFIFQQFNLLPNLTAEENIEVALTYALMPKKKRKEKAIELMKRVGLGDRIRHKPSELSGGQQQRVSIARALANDPDIILADEPTGALDSITGEEILELLGKLNENGKTVIIITHDMNIAGNTSRIITIKDGAITSDLSGGNDNNA